MENKKRYGLILNSKTKTKSKVKARLSAFSNDSSDEDNEGQHHVNMQIHKEAMKNIVKKQTKLEIQKALEEDATVYEYDNIYDDMKEKSKKNNIPESISKADKKRQPKYIGSLIKAADARSRERQRIEERKIEKERRQEGDMFNDKPAFVTSAYRKRMQERQEEEEQERKMAAIEDALDVSKQKDLSGFYRNFLRQQVGEEPTSTSISQIKNGQGKTRTDEDTVQTTKEEEQTLNEKDRDSDLSFSSSSSDEEETKSSKNLRNLTPGKTLSETMDKVSPNQDATAHKLSTSQSFVKRSNTDSMSSAKERYLARKKLKLSTTNAEGTS